MEIISRWSKTMPKFFKWIFGIATSLGAMALAVNESFSGVGITPPDWWAQLFPYLVGISAGAMAVSKFTVNGGYQKEESHEEDSQ